MFHCARVWPSLLLIAGMSLPGPDTAVAAATHSPYGKMPTNATHGDRMFADYFRWQTRVLAESTLTGVTNLERWEHERSAARRQLFEMLGLDPLPRKTDLKAVTTGVLESSEFTVEKLHFQSLPGLYITANLYLPKQGPKPVPAILYLCGHASVKTNGVSYGSKVAYQHHGIWFARNGYACLVLDTVELGEIEGQHHGTYREGMWWWNSRGYSAAAAEAWNCIRALDYLEQRPEIDPRRIGVTGRSGGGAYSWWVAALDDRIQAACPVAGITDLENHVVDGVVEGHCDCMYLVNTYRWDYAKVAALVAPRPLLICNTDKDPIFPLDGVVRLHEKVRGVYALYGAADRLGLLITEGGHADTQDLQVPVLRWFNRFLKGEQPLVQNAAAPMFTGQQLRVFETLPPDQVTSHCYEHFTRLADDTLTPDKNEILTALRQKTFGAWPDDPAAGSALITQATGECDGVQLEVKEYSAQPGLRLRLYVAQPLDFAPKQLRLHVMDEQTWREALAIGAAGYGSALKLELTLAGIDPVPADNARERLKKWTTQVREQRAAYVLVAPRGVGCSALSQDKAYRTQVRRRFMLLGQTLAGMQVWDIRRAVQTIRQLPGLQELPIHLSASPQMTEGCAFAALFEPNVSRLTLPQQPRADKDAPDFLNWSRIITPSQLLALTQERCVVHISQ